MYIITWKPVPINRQNKTIKKFKQKTKKTQAMVTDI